MIGKTDRRSAEAQRYRRLYKTARWKRTRGVHLAKQPICQACLKRGIVNDGARTPDGGFQSNPRRRFLVVHHVEPHKGDEDLFFNGPFETLCPDDHDKYEQQREVRGYSSETGEDGWPTDHRHPANK